jgi:hypothetical protein
MVQGAFCNLFKLEKRMSNNVINLDTKRKPAWDKPLTTEFEKDRSTLLVPGSENLASSRGRQGRVLGFRHKVFRS